MTDAIRSETDPATRSGADPARFDAAQPAAATAPADREAPAAWRARPGHRLALLLVDVDNAFFDPNGSFHYPAAAKVLDPLRDLLAAARTAGRLVVHAREWHRPGLGDFEAHKLPVHCVRNGIDALPFPGFEERPGEPVVPKRRYSAFFATDLALLLREQATERLIIAGVKTNVCVRATVQDAFAYGFRPTVVREAVNSNRPHLHAAALEDIGRYFGDVVDLGTALEWIGDTGRGDG